MAYIVFNENRKKSTRKQNLVKNINLFLFRVLLINNIGLILYILLTRA